MKDKASNRMIAYNAYEVDATGVIWCTVFENEKGYHRMTGSHPLQTPWYLAHWEHFLTREEALKSATELAAKWNEEQGYTKEDVDVIMASSMMASKLNG
tara:strand:- start:827 stop:1123 length:297 start_codon:yes stop_codon:yes gene_type:complete